jgi:carbon-monoxide dehydrogenase large subunit
MFLEHCKLPELYPLSQREVHFSGDPIAMVVADSRAVAEDAAELIGVDYTPLPPVTDPEDALRDGSATTFSDFDDNLGFSFRIAGGDAEKAIAGAAEVVECRVAMHRCGCLPLEGMVCTADWDDETGITVWQTTQRVHILRVALSDILRIPMSKIRVIAPRDIGGGFGAKAPIYREPFAVAHAARLLGRPVTWVQDRTEALTAGHERDGITYLRAGFTPDGRMLGMTARLIHDVGCAKIDQYQYLGPLIGGLVPAPYEISDITIDMQCALTNKAPSVLTRPAGRIPMVFAYERLFDAAARQLGMSPVEIRRKNLVQKHPYPTPSGITLEGDFTGAFDALLTQMNYDELNAKIAAQRTEGRALGIGVSVAVEMTPPPSVLGEMMYNQPFYASARVRVDADGEVSVYAGDSPQGQSRETTVAQAVADQLGVKPDAVRVVFGDTELSPFNNHTVNTQTAAHLAAQKIRAKILTIAAHQLVVASESELDLSDGEVFVIADPQQRRSLRRIARSAYLYLTELPPGTEPTLEETVIHDSGVTATNSFSAQACLVEVDPSTGVVKVLEWWYVGDSGRPMNPPMLEGSIHGGIATGISNAIYEQTRYDDDGNLLSDTMRSYLIAGAMEVPTMHVYHHDTPTETTALGHKKMVTEGVPGGAVPAITQAVEDALAGLGVTIESLPLSPANVREAIDRARRRSHAATS